MEQEQRLARIATGLALALALSSPVLADPFEDALAAYREGRTGHAAALFHQLALTGDGQAQYNLAVLFRVGQGLPRSDREALYWAWRARLSGVAQADRLQGLVSADLPAAERGPLVARLMEDLRPGLAAGDPAALLGAAALQGELADPPNLPEVWFWQALAATLGVPGADVLRDATAAQMPDADRAGLQDGFLLRFGDWCKTAPTPPESCAFARS